MEKNKLKKLIKELLEYVVIVIAVLLFMNFVFKPVYVPSESMQPTLMVGDYGFVYRLDRSIERKDIIVFKEPKSLGGKDLYVKRVIGLPGETVTVKDGKAYVDGKCVDPEAAVGTNGNGDGTYKVPDDGYFVMGDNRDNSWDARFWEEHCAKKEDLVGKYVFRYYPFSKFGRVK